MSIAARQKSMSYPTNRKNIVIFGAGGNGAAHLQSLKPNIALTGFIDNDPKKRGTMFCGHEVFGADDLATLQYDKIFIASTWALDILSQLSLSESFVREKAVDYTLRILSDILSAREADHHGLMVVTGNSYSFNAFHPGCFDHRILNLAMSSQDVETDYALLKYCLGKKFEKKISCVFIGIYHYIFDYEYSKRKKIEANSVYSFLTEHEPSTNCYQVFFSEHLSENIRRNYTQTLSIPAIASAFDLAQNRSLKSYASSRDKNLRVLEEMVLFLQDMNIRPIFTIIPMHPSYVMGIDKDNLSFLYAAIESLSAEHGVAIFDGLRMDLPNHAFGDATHLNLFGSYLFSSAIKEFVQTL